MSYKCVCFLIFYDIIKMTHNSNNVASDGGSVMTYKDIVERVREVFEYADARNIFEHIAIQINITGEGAGVMYFEVAQRQVTVEPYDYYDRDGLVTIDSRVIMDVCDKKYSLRQAYKQGLLTYQGNERKWLACLNNITLP